MRHCHELPVSTNTCYIRFVETEKVMNSAEIGTTARGEMMIADLDANGRVIGIELVAPTLKPCQQ
jgi:uncharacterized protein YuzE